MSRLQQDADSPRDALAGGSRHRPAADPPCPTEAEWMMSSAHPEPEDAADPGRVPPAALPDEADPADVLDQLDEVPDPEEEGLVLDDQDGPPIDPPDPWDRPGM